ncbi:MAG: 50S ribosomal protein L1 [Lachnospiraceae bacterium]|nr:50S ribosomal protein L1 [Lachnospiraceae bacterium]
MKKLAKKYVEKTKNIEASKLYEAKDAIALVKKNATAKFDETIELHIRTGCDSKYAEQQIRGSVVLPAGTGKKVKILVFAKDAKADEAKAAGADYVGADDYAQKIQSEGWLDFDAVVATPDMMGTIGKLAKILGPKGLMPNPKTGTVTADVTKIINELKAGKVEYRLDKQNLIHCPLGKASFSEDKLQENFDALINAIVKARPASLKGTFLKSITLTSTMGPGVRLNTVRFGS